MEKINEWQVKKVSKICRKTGKIDSSDDFVKISDFDNFFIILKDFFRITEIGDFFDASGVMNAAVAINEE